MTVERIPAQISVNANTGRKLMVPDVGVKLFHEQRPVSPLGASVCSSDIHDKKDFRDGSGHRRVSSNQRQGGRVGGRMARRSSTGNISSNYVVSTIDELKSSSDHKPRSNDENDDNECSMYDLIKPQTRKSSSRRLSVSDEPAPQDRSKKETYASKKADVRKDLIKPEACDRPKRRESLSRAKSVPRSKVTEKSSGGGRVNFSLSPVRPASNDKNRNKTCSLYDLNQPTEDELHPYVTDSPPDHPRRKGSALRNQKDQPRRRQSIGDKTGSKPDAIGTQRHSLSPLRPCADRQRCRIRRASISGGQCMQSIDDKPASTPNKKGAQRRHSLSPVRRSSDRQRSQVHRASISGGTQPVDCFENPPGQEINAQRTERRNSLSSMRYSLAECDKYDKYDDTHNRKKVEGQSVDPKSRLSLELLKMSEARRDRKAKKASSNSISNLRTLQF